MEKNVRTAESRIKRRNYSRISGSLKLPNLVEIQTDSFKWFQEKGIREVFEDIYPITNFNDTLSLEFVDCRFDEPKYDADESKERDAIYAAPLRATLRLVNKKTGEIKTSEVFMGDFPLMTDSGTFVVNGAERVIVSQLVRSPGAYFGNGTDKIGKTVFNGQVIPSRGTWLEFENDAKDVLNVRIDRQKKIPGTILLRALGLSSNEDIIEVFGEHQFLYNTFEKDPTHNTDDALMEIYSKLRPGEPATLDGANSLLFARFFDPKRYDLAKAGRFKLRKKLSLLDRIADRVLAEDVVDVDGNVVMTEGTKITKDKLEILKPVFEAGAHTREIKTNENMHSNHTIQVLDVYTDESKSIKMRVIGTDLSLDSKFVTISDFIAAYSYMLNLVDIYDSQDLAAEDRVSLMSRIGLLDDIDHLGNRRVRTVGELVQNQFRIGLSRMERVVKERMSLAEDDSMTPQSLTNIRPLTAAIKEFFASSQLSQFMDQINPLAELTNKRRLSALGPGGLSRERAGFEVRDVHYTHYGRLCPIESPEGPNIGLISSLCMYAKINDLGFIVTPYRKVNDSKVDMANEDVVYLTAEDEESKIIGQGNAPLTVDGSFIRDVVKCRQDADYPVVGPDQVDYVDVSPQQIASVSAGLIPFLEHDDGHRALMGCNMMRQAVPLLHNDAPIVGTGLEKQVCEDSRTMVTAEGEGVIEYVDATTIRILYDRTEDDEFVSFEPALKEYRIPKFRRTNQNMTIDLRPICNKGQRVKKGDILTEGYATENGELALGRNLLVAYIPWKGYNYEDAVVISERMVRDDVLTSVHVDEYSLDVRETKRGVEEFTSDIPNVSEEATKDLDDNGIVRVGARIEPGDIMIGKISPKGESDPSPEEKLLRAIFGDKAGDVKDSSLKANPSLSGVVIDKKLFSRAIKTRESKKQDKIILAKIDEEYEAKGDDLKDILVDKLLTLTEGMTSEGVKDYTGAEIITKGSTFTATALKNLEYDGVQSNKWTKDEHTNGLIQRLIMNYIRKYKQLDAELKRRKFAITIGDELPSGILQMAKVYIAKKRKIQVGDKLAGRHGNKGIVSKVVRLEDMPFMADGRPVDMVLNPLGVPSRMNLGQIFECILGAAGKKLGVKFATPIFDGAKLDDLSEWTDKAGLPRFCSTYLYDGETGEQFDQPATVGMTYFLKLGHMVEDKMHARSIGPYSLITQQPLGGKAQFGGQRFGEMEVWAIEAFGASHVLQEILTVKSDDVVGRSKAYEAIVKGDPMPTPGIPESLNVLLHELRGLGLSIKLD